MADVPATTSFGDIGVTVDDADASAVQISQPAQLYESIKSSTHFDNAAEITQFLSRPMVMQSGSVAATDDANTFTAFAPIYTLLGNAIFANKVSGKYSLRADVRLRLVINANAFQQGRYRMVWIPSGGVYGDTQLSTDWFKMHRASKVQISQLPGVDFDLATETSAEMLIPYNSYCLGFPQTAISLKNYGDLGWVMLYPYVALSSASGSTTADYVIWGSFENIQLDGAAIPQSNISYSKGKNITRKEQESAGVGPISGVLDKVSRSAKILGEIPLLSQFAMPTAWASDVLSRSAKVFGWSSPSDLSNVRRVVPFIGPYHASSDAPSSSMPISMLSENQVGVCPGFAGTNKDEMSLSYILGIYSYFKLVTWTTSTAVGDNLLSTQLKMDTFKVRITDGVDFDHCSTLNYVARCFKYWRGSLKLRFKIVKTGFHSGRIMFSYAPVCSRTGSNAAGSIANSAYNLREMVDIREKNQIDMIIPFVSITPFLHTFSTNDSIGYLDCWVVDRLVAPATVPSTIYIICEVCGGDDFEFAVPLTDTRNIPSVPWVYQSNILYDGSTEILSSVIGGGKVSSDPVADTELCIGEKVTSLRQLIKRFDLVGSTTTSAVYLRPWAMEYGKMTAASTYASTSGWMDAYNYFGMCFTYSRGGVRYRIVPKVAGDTLGFVNINHTASGNLADSICNSSADAWSMTNSWKHTGRLFFKMDQCGMMDFQVPQYHFSFVRANSAEACSPIANVTSSVSNGNCSPIEIYALLDTTTSGVNVFRSGAEDVSFGGFISCPPLAVSSTA